MDIVGLIFLCTLIASLSTDRFSIVAVIPYHMLYR